MAGINRLFQPFDGGIRVQSVHRGFEAGDDERATVDELKLAVRPTGLVQAEKFAQTANSIEGANTFERGGIPKQRCAASDPSVVV